MPLFCLVTKEAKIKSNKSRLVKPRRDFIMKAVQIKEFGDVDVLEGS